MSNAVRYIFAALAVFIAAMLFFASDLYAHADGSVRISSPQGSFTAYRMFTGLEPEQPQSPEYDSTTAPISLWSSLTGLDNPSATQSLSWLKTQVENSKDDAARKIGEAFDATGTGISFQHDETVTLPNGYYIITGTMKPVPVITLVFDGSVLDMETKPFTPTLDKKVDGTIAALASSKNPSVYTLTGSIPSGYEDYETYYYAFEDEMPPTMALDIATLKITFRDDETEYDITDKGEIKVEENHLSIIFDDLKQAVEKASPNATIEVSYCASPIDNIACGAVSPHINTAYLEYTLSPKNPEHGKSHEKQAVVYVLSFHIVKSDASDNNKYLPGAQFVIRSDDGMFYSDKGWVSNKEDASRLTTDENGTIKITAIPQGTYQIEELQAPDGYALLSSEVEVTVTASLENSSLTDLKASTKPGQPAKATMVDAAQGLVEITIYDDVASAIPSIPGGIIEAITGIVPQMGDVPLVIIAAMGAAGLLLVLVVAKSRSRKKTIEGGSRHE